MQSAAGNRTMAPMFSVMVDFLPTACFCQSTEIESVSLPGGSCGSACRHRELSRIRGLPKRADNPLQPVPCVGHNDGRAGCGVEHT